jgi:hypothetical protein
MIRLGLAAVVLAYLPGALIFRLPVAARERRAALDVEERVFWAVLLSVAWSLGAVLVLAAFDRYTLAALASVNLVLSAGLAAIFRRTLLYRGTARSASWTFALPVALVLLGCWRFTPPAEYIIGGKDPGTYMSEGVQVAERGSIVIHDPVVAAIPPSLRSLFIPFYGNDTYYSLRFMGFFVQDPDTGDVIGQFPHLLPASIAIGYSLSGLTGAELATSAWAVLGLLAVYFAGARLVGRVAASAAAVLLSLNVIEVWYGRYPNAEVAMQALLFAMLLAFARAHQDEDDFFAPVAGVLAGLLLFLRIDALLGLASLAAALVAMYVGQGRRPRVWFLMPLAVLGAVAAWYLFGPMRAYMGFPIVYLRNLPMAGLLAGGLAGTAGLGVLLWMRRHHLDRARAAVPLVVLVVLVGAAGYAWFLRAPGGRLTDYDAYALRTFTDFYLLRPGLVATLVGLILVVRRDFWRDPAFVVTVAAFSLFLFYKIHIVPYHFWMTRRFVPVILPGALLLAAAAAVGPITGPLRGWRLARPAIGMLFLALLGQRYVAAAQPVMGHVEYAGIVSYVRNLASRFGDHDLVVVESRNVSGSDTHVIALPLAYIFERNVLLLSSPRPDTLKLEAFLADARSRYEHVYFVGGGGTDLLSRNITAIPVADERVKVPEYDSPWNAYPEGIRRKDFDYSVYELVLGATSATGFSLDVGYRDDLNVVRFHAKETSDGRTVRWTGPQSFVAVTGLTGRERTLSLVMHDGGRPPQAPPARVTVYFNDTLVGTADVLPGFRTYDFALPPDAVARAAGMSAPAQLRLVSSTWNPKKLLGSQDDRDLGVMVDRVEVR